VALGVLAHTEHALLHAIEEARHVGDAALAVFESHGDDLGMCRAWCLKASIAWTLGHGRDADEAWRRGAEHAARAGEKRELFEILDWRASAAVVGPTPVEEAIEICLDIRNQVRSSPVAVAETLHPLAALHAMRGEFDAARTLIGEGNAILDELGGIYSAAMSHHEAFVEMLAGRPEVAEDRLRSAFERLEEMGGKELLATTATMLAQAILAQDRPEEASHFCRVSREAAAPEDLWSQVDGKGAYAKIIAGRGGGAEAERLAREAVELAASTDFLTLHGDAFLDLAAVDLSRPVEHFGYRDRISTVQIEGTGIEPTPGSFPASKPGEFVLGYPDDIGVVAALPKPEIAKGAGGDLMRTRESNRKKLAETEKQDAS